MEQIGEAKIKGLLRPKRTEYEIKEIELKMEADRVNRFLDWLEFLGVYIPDFDRNM